MLRAYDYFEFSGELDGIYDVHDLEEELKLAKEALKAAGMAEFNSQPCTACGSKKTVVFFEKWGVPYCRCQECESVFVPMDEQILRRYSRSDALRKHRTTREYQSGATEKRQYIWEDLIDWISFRTFRYLGSNTNMKIADYGNRYTGLIDMLKGSDLCGTYTLKNSILASEKDRSEDAGYDIVLFLDNLQQTIEPFQLIAEAWDDLREGGLLYISSRAGTGFDILTLKEHAKIFPYEHIFLPSIKGMETGLKNAGFRLLEWSTPGTMDVGYVRSKMEHIHDKDYFIKSLMKHGDNSVMGEFQRFLQKSGMSSHARIIAQKVSVNG